MINPRFGKLRVAVASVLALVAGTTVYFAVGGSQVTALTDAFSEDFSSPTAFTDRFVFHVGNACSLDQTCRPETLPDYVPHEMEWSGDHSMACEGPTTARTVHAAMRSEMLYQCTPGGDPSKGHLMSSMMYEGYGILSFSPNQTFTNVERVCWDINATDLGGGKWTNVVLVPTAEYLRHPNNVMAQPAEGPYRMDYTTPGFNTDNAPGDFNLQSGDLLAGNGPFGLKNFRETLMLFHGDQELWLNPEAPVTTDKAARFQHCMIDTPTGVQITRARVGGGTDTYTVPGVHMPDGDVRVIFQDDMYNPPKRDGYSPANNTWHWDNIQVSTASGSTPTTAAPTPTTAAPTPTTAAPTPTTAAAAPTTAAPTPTTAAAAPTTAAPTPTTAAPTPTTVASTPTTVTSTLALAQQCPAGWRTATGACRVPAPVMDFLMRDLGRRRGMEAVASLEAWYATRH